MNFYFKKKTNIPLKMTDEDNFENSYKCWLKTVIKVGFDLVFIENEKKLEFIVI